MIDKTERIRALNDKLRTTGAGGDVILTRALASLPEADLILILTTVKDFTNFTPDNDPHGEHDCAVLTAASQRVIFKIDYYDKAKTYGSDDPSDPERTCRVLTIMLASDY